MFSAHSAITPVDVPPPVPTSIVERIQDQPHPFMLGTREQFRKTERRMKEDLNYARYKEFIKRVEMYVTPDTPWYIGEGPLHQTEDFHPRFLRGADMKAYTQVMMEVIAFTGMELERWSINRLQNEFLRLLEALEAGELSNIVGWTPPAYSLHDAKLLAIASLTYDMVYQRFDTKDRHELNRQLKDARDKLADYCASINPAELTPTEQTVFGTALGLSTLMCMSVYEFEWENEGRFSVQAFLPDLYRGITLTRQGMENLATVDRRIHANLDDLQETLLTAIPWIECMKRMGYSMFLRGGTYALIFDALQSHKLPASAHVVLPYIEEELKGPWLPMTQPLYWEISPAMYQGSVREPKPFSALKSKPEAFQQTDSFGVPDRLAEKREVVHTGEPMTLREMLERFGQPQPEPEPTPTPSPEDRLREEAGWSKPKGLELPPMWGGLYQLAAADVPDSGAKDAWEAWGPDLDSHPYSYLYQSHSQSSFQPQQERHTLLNYPDWRFSMLSMDSYRDPFVLATQSANNTVLASTFALDHQSFLMKESGTQWHWIHEATATETANKNEFKDTFEEPRPTSLITSLFSAWQTENERGKTLMLRRHLSGVGGAYTVVAHYPEKESSKPPYRNIVFSTPGETKITQAEDVQELYRILPESAATYQEPAGYYEWQQIRRMERSGEIEPKQVGVLNVLFSPGAVEYSLQRGGVLGNVFDIQLKAPENPFFYIMGLEQPGREMFDTKYGGLPIDNIRLVEWNQGIDLIAISGGEELENPFVHTDAELAVVVRDRNMDGLFYAMMNGTYLRAKFSPTQDEYVLLADTAGQRTSIAWSQRRLHATIPPNANSRFFAPDIVGFNCPGTVIDYGRKGRQAVVWGHEKASRQLGRR